jgi:hypothetical protein
MSFRRVEKTIEDSSVITEAPPQPTERRPAKEVEDRVSNFRRVRLLYQQWPKRPLAGQSEVENPGSTDFDLVPEEEEERVRSHRNTLERAFSSVSNRLSIFSFFERSLLASRDPSRERESLPSRVVREHDDGV